MAGDPWDDQTWRCRISETTSLYFARHVQASSMDEPTGSHFGSEDRGRRLQPDVARGSCVTAIRTLMTSTEKADTAGVLCAE